MSNIASKSRGDIVQYSKFVFVYRQGVYGNALLLSRLEELSDSIEADFQSGNDAIVESMNGKTEMNIPKFIYPELWFLTHLCIEFLSTDCLKIDEQAASSMLAIIDCKSQAAQELDACHKTGVSDIKCQSDSCFNNDYMVDNLLLTFKETKFKS